MFNAESHSIFPYIHPVSLKSQSRLENKCYQMSSTLFPSPQAMQRLNCEAYCNQDIAVLNQETHLPPIMLGPVGRLILISESDHVK